MASPGDPIPVPGMNATMSNSSHASSGVQQLSLRWSDYPHTLASTFRLLKEEEDFVDVTLACHAQQFTAHRVVLSACSPYFRQLLKANPCQHPIVILRDVNKDDLAGILRFMYNGEVQIPEDRLKDFLKTAETLQIRGLADGEVERFQAKENNAAAAISTTMDQDPSIDNGLSSSSHQLQADAAMFGPSAAKRHRAANGAPSPRSVTPTPTPTPTLALQRERPWEKRGGLGLDSDNNNKNQGESLLGQALEKQTQQRIGVGVADDSASDTASDRPESLMDGMKASESDSLQRGSPATAITSVAGSPLFPPGLEALYRQAGFPPAFLGLAAANAATSIGGGPHSAPSGSPSGAETPTRTTLSGLPTPSVPQVGLQSHAANPNIAGKLDMMRVRATDPRPCPKCGKIYRSAHTLRTHMEDKHTVCPGYRCVLCGTVAKSRNSLHSHMSRQHRGISTKDLPVVPMPAPFDAELASRLLAKAGVKVSPTELSARASPTAPRRSDLPKLDTNFLTTQQQQFPLPASMPTSMGMFLNRAGTGGEGSSGGGSREGSDLEDLRVPPASSPFSGTNGGGPAAGLASAAAQLRNVASMNPKDFAAMAAAASTAGGGPAPGGMGSALLDTYLSMIAAATGNAPGAAPHGNGPDGGAAAPNAAMAAALSFGRNNPFVASAASMGISPPTNGEGAGGGGKDSDADEREEDMGGELGSDADNDDISDGEESSKLVGRGHGSPGSRGEPETTHMDEPAAATTAAN